MPPATTAPVTKTFETVVDYTPALGPDEVVSVITSDKLDRDHEVLIPAGGIFENYRRNPVVMYGHAKGLPTELYALPVGINKWLKTSPDGHQLLAKTKFDLDDDMGRRVGGQTKRGVLKTFSITFNPIRFGPPTREELARRPDWRGAKCIYREWELLEYSVVAIPANTDAVTIAKAQRSVPGVHAPPFTEYPHRPDAPIRAGDYLRIAKAPHCRGIGKCMSVHKGEMVPDVDNDLYGSRDEPALRVKLYKIKDSAFVPTSYHVGCKAAHCVKIENYRRRSDTVEARKQYIQSPEFRKQFKALSIEGLGLSWQNN